MSRPMRGTSSSGQHVSRPSHTKMIPGAVLRKSGNSPEMLPFTFRQDFRRLVLRRNISMRFCSKLMWSAVVVRGRAVRCRFRHAVPTHHYAWCGRTREREAGEKRDRDSESSTAAARGRNRDRSASGDARGGCGRAAVASRSRIDDAVEQIAAQHSLNADLLHAVIKVESNYNPAAVSNKGRWG